jgi:hypothetical protein
METVSILKKYRFFDINNDFTTKHLVESNENLNLNTNSKESNFNEPSSFTVQDESTANKKSNQNPINNFSFNHVPLITTTSKRDKAKEPNWTNRNNNLNGDLSSKRLLTNRPLTSSLARNNYSSTSFTNHVLGKSKSNQATILYKFADNITRDDPSPKTASSSQKPARLLSVINIDTNGKPKTSNATYFNNSTNLLTGSALVNSDLSIDKSYIAFDSNNFVPKFRTETPDPKTRPGQPRLTKMNTNLYNSNSNNSLQIVKSTLQTNHSFNGISSPIKINQIRPAKSKENLACYNNQNGETFKSVSTYFDNSNGNNNTTNVSQAKGNNSTVKKKNSMYTTNYYFYNNLSSSPSNSSQNNNYASLSINSHNNSDEKKKALIKNYLKRSMAKWSSANLPTQQQAQKPQSGDSISRFTNKSLMNFKDYTLPSEQRAAIKSLKATPNSGINPANIVSNSIYFTSNSKSNFAESTENFKSSTMATLVNNQGTNDNANYFNFTSSSRVGNSAVVNLNNGSANNYVSASSTYLNPVDMANYEYRLNLLKSKNETNHVATPPSVNSKPSVKAADDSNGEQATENNTSKANPNNNNTDTIEPPKSRSQTPNNSKTPTRTETAKREEPKVASTPVKTHHNNSSSKPVERKQSKEIFESNKKLANIVKQVNANYTGNGSSPNNNGKNKTINIVCNEEEDNDEYEEETAELLAEERIYLANVTKKCNEWLSRHVFPYLETMSTSSTSFNNEEYF